jgi:subtilisin family serine protease
VNPNPFGGVAAPLSILLCSLGLTACSGDAPPSAVPEPSFDVQGANLAYNDDVSVEGGGMSVSFNDGNISQDHVVGQDFLTRLRVGEAHEVSRGSGVRIALLDTGVDPHHPELEGRIRAGRDLVDNDGEPWEARAGQDNDGDGLFDEGYGHGTHLAGLIAMLAPEAEIVVYRVLGPEGWGTATGVSQAMTRAVNEGADIINLSLGMGASFRAVEQALTYAADRDVLVVTSAGNRGVSIPEYPAFWPTSIAVGSAGEDDALSEFSNYGPHLFVSAPGESILSLYPGGGYAAWSGTSMAAAVVSSLAGLVLAQDPTLGAAAVANRIAASTVPGTGTAGITGHGRVDFAAALSEGITQVDPKEPTEPGTGWTPDFYEP